MVSLAHERTLENLMQPHFRRSTKQAYWLPLAAASVGERD
jgi:hypothetical protein